MCTVKMKGMLQELKDFLFHNAQVLHFGHKPVDRLDQVFEDIIIAQLIMGDQVQQPGITLQVGPQVNFPVNDLVKVFYGFIVIPCTEAIL
jgi:hypothetical protein